MKTTINYEIKLDLPHIFKEGSLATSGSGTLSFLEIVKGHGDAACSESAADPAARHIAVAVAPDDSELIRSVIHREIARKA